MIFSEVTTNDILEIVKGSAPGFDNVDNCYKKLYYILLSHCLKYVIVAYKEVCFLPN